MSGDNLWLQNGSRRSAYEYYRCTRKKNRKRRQNIDDEFVVHDIKVIEGEKGLFIAMPSRKSTDGEYRDIAHPINTQTRDRIQSIVLEAYEKAEAVPEE